MITLSKKLKEKKNLSEDLIPKKRISIRDKLLIKEVSELDANLPEGVTINFSNPDCLSSFTIKIAPTEGIWASGSFNFSVSVPEDYNIVPPMVKCETRLWHPNINEEGDICLSLLRQNSIDSLGWAPTRKLKDLIWGLNSLFSDLLNFDDPLNIEAADHYLSNQSDFQAKVKDYIKKYCNHSK